MLEKHLFQFAYTLTNFDRTDQIRYLEEIWQANSNVPLTESVHKFASSLVDRVSETLKDDERSFIGIPLQCRIIAECFQSDMEAILQTNVDRILESPPLQMNFDVISLYSSFMDTKRRVFEEKNNALSSSPTISYALNFLIKKIESHLTDLAINTIVEKEEDMRLLWPYLRPFQSLVAKTKEDDEMEENTLKYGLTIKEGGKLQFLHRIFAEYILARYLYEGFLLDDDKQNGLLDNKEVRLLIVNKILVYDQYNGVRFFFDAMLKDIVNSLPWRNKVGRRFGRLPERYFELARSNYAPNYRALSTALLNRHKNIFTLLCDSLDATQLYGQMLVRYTFDDHFWFFIHPQDYYAQSREILKRLLTYYKGASVKEVKKVLLQMMQDDSGGQISKMHILLNQKDRKENIKTVLKFMHQNRKILKQMDERMNPNLEMYKSDMLDVLLCNKFYNDLIKQYLELLSWLYANKDRSLMEILNKAIAKCCSKHKSDDGTIEKILYTLRDLGRLNVVHRISCVILKWNPTAFEHFYQLHLPQEIETVPTDIQSLLVENSAGMTRMHRAAFYGDIKASQQLLDFRLTPDNRKIAQQLRIDHYMACDGDLLTPLHIAATREHGKIVRNTLKFFKKVVSDHKLRKDLAKTSGLLYNVMKDAIMYKNYNTIKIILQSVQLFLGREYLIDLLKSQNKYVCRDANLLTIVANIEGEKEYEFLIHLLIKDKNNSEIVRNIDDKILLGMLTAKGQGDFVEWFLTANLSDGFERISQLFDKLEIGQLSNIVNAIISTSNGKSYWVKWLNQEIGAGVFMLTVGNMKCFLRILSIGFPQT